MKVPILGDISVCESEAFGSQRTSKRKRAATAQAATANHLTAIRGETCSDENTEAAAAEGESVRLTDGVRGVLVDRFNGNRGGVLSESGTERTK